MVKMTLQDRTARRTVVLTVDVQNQGFPVSGEMSYRNRWKPALKFGRRNHVTFELQQMDLIMHVTEMNPS